jgi:hypothetical protein
MMKKDQAWVQPPVALMKNSTGQPIPLRQAFMLLVLLGCCCLFSSCSTPPRTDAAVYRIRVVRYEPPIETASWTASPLLATDPEGAAFDIASAMRQGDVERWLSYCQESAGANPDAEARQALLRQWQSLQGGRLTIVGRVIAGADVVVELSLTQPQRPPEKLQIPLTKSHDRWWLTVMDPSSEFLNWEKSPDTIVDHMNPDMLGKRRGSLQSVAISR